MQNINHDQDTLYCFYDMEVSPCSYDFFSFLYSAEICRVRRNLKKINMALVQGPNRKYRSDNNYRSFERNETFFNNVISPGLTVLPSISSYSWQPRESMDINGIPEWNKFPRGYSETKPFPAYLSRELVAANSGDKPGRFVAPDYARKLVNDFINSRIGSKPFITITARELDRR